MSEVDGPKSVTGNRGLMLPPPLPARAPKRKREQKVLDEEEWTEKLEAIVQRDYFPDIPKLENELEWLEVSCDLTARKLPKLLLVTTTDKDYKRAKVHAGCSRPTHSQKWLNQQENRPWPSRVRYISISGPCIRAKPPSTH